MPKYSYRRDDVLDREEVSKMIEAEPDPSFKSLIAFLYVFGCRISEALALEKKDVKLLKRTMNVRLLTLKKRDRGTTTPHRLNVARLDSPFLDVFLARLGMVSEGKIWKMNRKTVWRHIKKVNPNCSPHLFRHTRATRFALAGAEMSEMWAWFDWSDMNTGAKYIHASGRLAAKLSGKID